MRNRVRWPGLVALAVLLAVLVASPAGAAKPKDVAVEVGGQGAGLAPSSDNPVGIVAPDDECMRLPGTTGVGTDGNETPNCGGYVPPPPPPPPAPAPPPPCCNAPPPPAPAPPPPPAGGWIGCKTFYAYRGLNHVLGYMLYRYYVQKEFCSNGFSLYVDNTWRWVEVNVGWQFQGHIDSTQTTGSQQRSYYSQGKFSPPLASAFATRYPWLTVCYGLANNGAFSICGSGG